MKEELRICKVCEKEFHTNNNKRIYCSSACNTKACKTRNEREYAHVCKFCKKEFFSKLERTRFCSPVCVGKFKNKKGTGNKSNCKECDKEFSQKNKRHYFCSILCKRRYQSKIIEQLTVSCSNCNKKIKRNKYVAVKDKLFFCSKKCEGEFRHEEAKEVRICEFCHENFECKRSEILRFCSMRCQSEWQKITGTGKNHPSYKHEITDEMRVRPCEYCGKERVGTPKYFETHKYCCKRCFICAIKKTMTAPHVMTCEILEELSIDFVTEERMGRYSFDCYIPELNLAIEVMGGFFHCDIRKFKRAKYDQQKNSIGRDKRKKALAKENNISVLYLWEDDIYKKREMCKELITKFIEKNGILNNYHSMNYSYRKEKLILNRNRLVPHLER